MFLRIQTIYLFLAFLCGFIYIFFAAYYISSPHSTTLVIFPYYDFVQSLWTIFGISTPFLHFIAIFFYKKRKMQIKVCNVAIISLVCLIFVVIYFCLSSGHQINYIAILVPIISFFLTIKAIKAIKKDEKLINSTDRLR